MNKQANICTGGNIARWIDRKVDEQIGKYTCGNIARWIDKYTDGQIEDR